ncbi:hypothetical protein ACFFX0_19350 [Citricoccus parietis]|uniref:Uncharacterized protein n=1 Tax=Citricoccus parietis TaxID=592307 RepID=A0ABV5G2S5_9MICC
MARRAEARERVDVPLSVTGRPAAGCCRHAAVVGSGRRATNRPRGRPSASRSSGRRC